MPPPQLTDHIKSIQGVRLAGRQGCWDIHVEYAPKNPKGIIKAVTPHESPSTDVAHAPLALPALTHPHIHLDKAYIHNAPEYADLRPSTGFFDEALSFTTKAKERFTYADVLRRGEWLLAESLSSGVTAMRAFVEVDHTVQLTCLEAAVALKEQWKGCCEIQIACFAQDPLFSGVHGDENMSFFEEALQRYPTQIDVLATTPYVESSVEAAKRNIEWAINRARSLLKHVDFHLDYNLNSNTEPLVWHVLRTLRLAGWTKLLSASRVMLGHCTRLTLLPSEEWHRLACYIHEHDLPVSFVGLPTSDLYMASRPIATTIENFDRIPPHDQPKGTLQVVDMVWNQHLDAVIGVNNVGNAFTPWGSPDPLSLASLGVGIYRAGSQMDAELLYQCVSTRARAAIGLSLPDWSLTTGPGGKPELLLFHVRDDTGCGVSRPRASVAEIVWDPPARSNRDVVFGGRLKPSLNFAVRSETMDRLYQFS